MPRDCRILIAVVASFNQYEFMRGLRTPTLNFRAVGVFGSPQDKFAFSVLFVRLLARKCLLIIQLFLQDLASLLKEMRYLKKNGEHCKSGSVV